MQRSLCEQHGEDQGQAIFRAWFAIYWDADIIDTGVYDSQAADFLAEVQHSAELAGLPAEPCAGQQPAAGKAGQRPLGRTVRGGRAGAEDQYGSVYLSVKKT